MKKIYECQITGKQFKDREECLRNEVKELNIKGKYEDIFKDVIQKLNDEFSTKAELLSFDIRCYHDYYECDNIEVNAKIVSNHVEDIINYSFTDYYDYKDYTMKTSDEIYKSIRDLHFTPKIQSKYVGILSFEDYMGGHGADDYTIGEVHMRTIYNAFKGKKVELKIIE